MEELNLSETEGFDWNEGNIEKNKEKHYVDYKECEEVFGDEPYFMEDVKHSQFEKRFIAFGKTYTERILFIVFTLRSQKVRVISARDTDKKEKEFYIEKMRK